MEREGGGKQRRGYSQDQVVVLLEVTSDAWCVGEYETYGRVIRTSYMRTRAFLDMRRAWTLLLCQLRKPEELSGVDSCLRGLTDYLLCQ